MNRYLIGALVVAGVAARSAAQSSVDPAHKFAWAENVGWTNWHDAGTPPGASGVRVHGTFLSGFAWAENVGWINFGDGDPGPPGGTDTAYANVNGQDSGVNLDDVTGELSGYAWGENVGWINFAGGALASPPNLARLDLSACRLRGFVWGENTGWLNLDHASVFIGLEAGACGPPCPSDIDHDGDVDLADLSALLSQFGSNGPGFSADLDHDGDVDLTDLTNLLSDFGTVC
jgi:hypothetical protein